MSKCGKHDWQHQYSKWYKCSRCQALGTQIRSHRGGIKKVLSVGDQNYEWRDDWVRGQKDWVASLRSVVREDES